jgi:hypothetical protein
VPYAKYDRAEVARRLLANARMLLPNGRFVGNEYIVPGGLHDELSKVLKANVTTAEWYESDAARICNGGGNA